MNCKYKTESCSKRGCELEDFLETFIKHRFKKQIEEIEFQCLDKSGEGGKKAEILIDVDNKKYVIEAKSFLNNDVHVVKSYANNLFSLIDKFSDAPGIKIKKLRSKLHKIENTGISIQFDESLLLLAPILHNSDPLDAKLEFISKVVTEIYNKMNNLIDNIKGSSLLRINIEKYKYNEKMIENTSKRIKREYADLDWDELEKKYGIRKPTNVVCESDLSYDFNLLIDGIKNKDKILNLLIYIDNDGQGIKLGGRYLTSTVNNEMEKHVKRLIIDAEKKFLNYINETRILFFNSDLVQIPNYTDKFDNLLNIIKNNVNIDMCDEVWIEYYTPEEVCDDNINYVLTSKNNLISYKKIV